MVRYKAVANGTHCRVVDKPNILISSDNLSTEVSDADVPIPNLTSGQVHAVDGDESTGHHSPKRLFDEELIMIPELVMIPSIVHNAI